MLWVYACFDAAMPFPKAETIEDMEAPSLLESRTKLFCLRERRELRSATTPVSGSWPNGGNIEIDFMLHLSFRGHVFWRYLLIRMFSIVFLASGWISIIFHNTWNEGPSKYLKFKNHQHLWEGTLPHRLPSHKSSCHSRHPPKKNMGFDGWDVSLKTQGHQPPPSVPVCVMVPNLLGPPPSSLAGWIFSLHHPWGRWISGVSGQVPPKFFSPTNR